MLQELEELYRTRFPAYLRVARAVVGDRERALEAVQDAFADALRSCDSFRGEGSLEAWVWRIVVNSARKAARRPLVEPALPHAIPGADPSLRDDVAPIVRSLPERQRLVLFLRYYADLDYRSIADALGVEVGTVSSSLVAARAAVQRALSEVKSCD